ncbi:MAG: GNAT family N-acetyltransferase [Janthinobacterium sp.]
MRRVCADAPGAWRGRARRRRHGAQPGGHPRGPGGHGFVSLVVVAPGQQRRGVGLRLLAAAADACRTEKLFTSTNQSNGAAQRLFASAGFVRSGRIEHLDEGDPELVYMKWCR